MQQPSRSELAQSLAAILGAGTSTLVVDPSRRAAAISNDLDREGVAVAGTEPRLLRARRAETQPESAPPPAPAPSETPDASASEATSGADDPEPPEPSFDERLGALHAEVSADQAKLRLLESVERAATRVAREIARHVEPQAPAVPPASDERKSERANPYRDAVRAFGAATSPDEIDAAVKRIGELAGAE